MDHHDDNAMRTARGPGRPPLPEEARRDSHLRVRVSPRETARLQRAADRVGTSLSDWVRTTLLAAARELGRDPGPPTEDDEDVTPPTDPPPG
jgi:hypothetical protein